MKGPDVKLSFGKRVRALRLELRLSQEGLAHVCGLDRSYLGGVERGERNISLENICVLAHALNVPPSTLLEFPKR